MKTTDFAKHLSAFLGHYLPVERGISINTIKSYSTTFSLLIQFIEKSEGTKAENLCLNNLSRQLILKFLEWLEQDRACCQSSRNARLGAIHSFFKYLQYRDIKGISKWQDILSIEFKKSPRKEMAYLSTEGIQLLLKQPNIKTKIGRRDFVLLGLLYDSAARVQELLELTPCDIRFDETTTIRLLGKGSKIRIVPLSSSQARNLKQYMLENDLLEKENLCKPLFCNPHGDKLSRVAILNIVRKYSALARITRPDLIPDTISCHSFRHSKAIHMLEADINLVYIRDFLGHSSTNTTDIYARVSQKKKDEAMQKLNTGIIKECKTTWQKDKPLLSFLKDLQRKY